MAVQPMTDSVRNTPGRPTGSTQALAAEVYKLHCPMCGESARPKVRWDMHSSNHGLTMVADASGYAGQHSSVFARVRGGTETDCMSHPGGFGCPGPH
ncbi:hypothetical protein GUITHDRAFT_153545 [Guillardia theta CCMP2712]|uniref:Uncharacterized protein n=1 Tax=Guillardia theta (strain CCMP2712) TaxID=905079 RepID=L1J334_GUITC|nr:hypothetical protein GUITHDRAFT_153545 [Guillardia theta CCMP2712]EKX42505.1 hypothetical protein GUITHDRAFT_153545 [Guillardia theta CCMP2712]|eukprot:XP_005829485.1 hypothetical protein GUITHDRAFT_153545 [Guillardia theta CCMP2712]